MARSIKKDKQVKALHAGKRKSESGNVYYESRPNRSDKNRTKKFKKGGQTKAGIKQDKKIKALHAGKRTSENGNTYYESRPNRSDENRTKKLEEGGGTEKSHEDLVNEKLDSNGEISYSDFKSIIGREPCYPVCHVGGSKYRKQFLRGCYRKMGGNY